MVMTFMIAASTGIIGFWLGTILTSWYYGRNKK